MRHILGITNELSQALQRSDQDIINVIALVRVCKERLQSMRNDGCHTLLNEVSLFCEKQDINIPNMDDAFITQGRSKHKVQKVLNLHHFQVELFYQVIDRQLQELNNRCGSNAFQDDAKESRVKQVSRIKIKIQDSSKESRLKIQESREYSIKISIKRVFQNIE